MTDLELAALSEAELIKLADENSRARISPPFPTNPHPKPPGQIAVIILPEGAPNPWDQDTHVYHFWESQSEETHLLALASLEKASHMFAQILSLKGKSPARPKLEIAKTKKANVLPYPWKKGDEVKHADYGTGIITIVAAEHDYISVLFADKSVHKFKGWIVKLEKTGKIILPGTTENTSGKPGKQAMSKLDKFISAYTKMGMTREKAVELVKATKLFPELG